MLHTYIRWRICYILIYDEESVTDLLMIKNMLRTHLFMMKNLSWRPREIFLSVSTVSEPDPDWIRNQLGQRIQIQAGRNCSPKKKKMQKFHVLW